MKKHILFFVLILSLGNHILLAQGVAINEDNSDPHGSAMLDVKASNKGILIPRLTQSQRISIASPARGLLVYQIDNTVGFWYYNGSAWEALGGNDNLGNHIATENIRLGSNYLSGDGANEGIFINNAGQVSMGNNDPRADLHVGEVFTTPVGDRSIYVARDGGDTYLELASGDMSEGVIMHANGPGNESGLVYNLNSNGYMNGRPQGLHLFNRSGSPILFTTNNTERMRIEPNGFVGIGTVSPSRKLEVVDNSTVHIAEFINTNTTFNADGIVIQTGLTTNPAGNNSFIFFLDGDGTTIGSIAGNSSGGVNYNTSSDFRLKQDIEPLVNALERISVLKPKEFSYKTSIDKRLTGFIAQDVMEVFPEAVSGEPDGDLEKNPMMVNYSYFTPLLTAGIQELEQRLNLLEKQVDIQQEIIRQLELKLASFSAQGR